MRQKRMTTIAVVNHKGGVGKTTTTFNLGAELANKGRKVLLVDFDMQGNLTTACGLDTDNINGTIADALNAVMEGNTENLSEYKIIRQTQVNNMDVVPCNLDMANTMLTLQNAIARERQLQTFLEEYENDYDICLIDCAPSILVDFQNALVASDKILIVTSPDAFSANGILSLLENFSKVKRFFNANLSIAGVLINNVDKRTKLHNEMSNAIREVWGSINIYDSYIPRTIRLQESIGACLPISEAEYNNNAAKAFRSFADEFVESLQANYNYQGNE